MRNPDENLTAEFWANTEQMISIFTEKNKMYGKKNICRGNTSEDIEEALFLIMIRLGDKFSRLKTMLRSGDYGEGTDESITDTLIDIANYAVIAKIVHDGKWV